jgi:Concanavalin A-like lectin/glucanases superfamily
MRSRLCAAVAAVLTLGVLTVPASAARQLPTAAAATSSALVARYNFDGRAGAVLDASGNGHTMRLISSRGGKLRVVRHGSGNAMQFPAPCSGAKCPHAVLQSPHTADLNPGRRPILFGATVRLPAGQTTKGQNVVQKGYSIKGSQYKLQIDGMMGRPSCVLVDTAKRGIRMVRSAISVADGRWHAIQCRRVGSTFAVLIDGAVRGVAQIPAALTVANKAPLSIGGKGAYRDNDQFQGALDDVWVQIG